MNDPNTNQSWRNQKCKDSSSSGSSFHATATPFIPRLAPGISNPGSFYQPTPLITHSAPEQPPSPYYPLESATFMPPDTPAGSALPSPSFLGPEEDGTHEHLDGSPKDNDSGGVSLSRERSATSPAREVSSAGINEGPTSSPSGHNRVISDLGPLPPRGFEQAMHSRRLLHEQSIWDQSWLQDPERKWIETGRPHSNTTISPGALSNGERRGRSDSQSTVTAEPTPREKMLQSLRDVAKRPVQNLYAAQPTVYDTPSLANQQESMAGISTDQDFRSSKLTMNRDSRAENFPISRANPLVSVRLGIQGSPLENVAEEDGMKISIGHDYHLSFDNQRQHLEPGIRAGNIARRNAHSGPTRSNIIKSTSPANVHWDQTLVSIAPSDSYEGQADAPSYLMGYNLNSHPDIASLQTHGNPVDSINYDQSQVEHLNVVSRARAATTPLSFRRGHEEEADLRQQHGSSGEQGLGEYGDIATRVRERAYTLAPEYASEILEQSANKDAVCLTYITVRMKITNEHFFQYTERASAGTQAPQPPNTLSYTLSDRALATQAHHMARNAHITQEPQLENQSPIGLRSFPSYGNQYTARAYRQHEAVPLQGQVDIPQLRSQDHFMPNYNAMGYGQPKPAAYSSDHRGYGQLNYRHSGYTQHNADTLGYGPSYYDARHPTYNAGFGLHMQHRSGPEPYLDTLSSYPCQGTPQPHSVTRYTRPHLPLQHHSSEYLHSPYLGAALLPGQSQNALDPGHGFLQHGELLQHLSQPMPEWHQPQQFGAQQPPTVIAATEQALRLGGVNSVQQYKGGSPPMQHSGRPMHGSSVHHSPRIQYNNNRMATDRYPLPELALEPASAAPTVLYRAGTDTMYPMNMGGPSSKYQDLTSRGQPSFEEASKKMPFIELARHAKPAEWGVLRIGNIPYSVTKQEILAFLGRNAKIITPDLGCAIHIIMERATGKTMDCFVEFLSSGDALAAVNRFVRHKEEGRSGRIGDRHVDVEMSGQDSLMKELFPRAKNVVWHGADPAIFHSTEPFNSGFKGFITSEEMVMTVKHAETPHRYPWWVVESYTLADRNLLFRATEQLVRALVGQLMRGGNTSPQMNEQLLTELVYAGLNAPGFSEGQRAQLVGSADWVGGRIRISPLASVWPFEVLGRKPDIDEDVIEYFAACLRKATTSSALVSLAELSQRAQAGAVARPFGNVTVSWPANKENMTMAAAAAVEWGVVENLLRKVLGGATEASQA
ncbi:MAG: hypothetical protein M1836_001899 [Candelina mexicana]|nr:MAG: hypothetical protein M1836_001899 [Candelina mexicana]